MSRTCPNCNSENISSSYVCSKCGSINVFKPMNEDNEAYIELMSNCFKCESETIKQFECDDCGEVFFKNSHNLFGIKIA